MLGDAKKAKEAQDQTSCALLCFVVYCFGSPSSQTCPHFSDVFIDYSDTLICIVIFKLSITIGPFLLNIWGGNSENKKAFVIKNLTKRFN